MAKLCEACGKRNNPFVGDVFYLTDDKVLCYKCAEKIGNDINDLYYVKTNSGFQNLKNKIIDKCANYFDDATTEYISIRINEIYIKIEPTLQKDQCEDNCADNVREGSNFKINSNIGPFENQDLVYKIDGVRGRHIDIYTDKVVITTKVTLGSLITHNATDGEKTIYYSDCIGVQFKQAKFTIGYLQLETASSNGNHKNSNFFDENAFTYDTTVISNERMVEVVEYVKSRIDIIKKGEKPSIVMSNNNISVADELIKLKQLLDIGVLTQEEFDKQKNKLLNT